MSNFWQAVSISEVTCNLYVTATVSDGASANNNFYKMHSMLDNKIDANVVSRIINLCDRRIYILFFPHAPHFIKTRRNCIFHSGIQCFVCNFFFFLDNAFAYLQYFVGSTSIMFLYLLF